MIFFGKHKHQWKTLRWRYNSIGAFFAEVTNYCYCGQTRKEDYVENFRRMGLTEREFVTLERSSWEHTISSLHEEHLKKIQENIEQSDNQITE